MSNLLIQDSTLTGIANAIRAKDGTSSPILVSNLAQRITDLPSGGAFITGNATGGIISYDSTKDPNAALITNSSYMFSGVASLSTADITKLVNLTNGTSMFSSASSLTSIDISKCTLLSIATNMFNGCTRLTNVVIGNLPDLVNAASMFNACTYLPSIDISGLTAVKNASNMLKSCTSLTSITLSATCLHSVTNSSNIAPTTAYTWSCPGYATTYSSLSALLVAQITNDLHGTWTRS